VRNQRVGPSANSFLTGYNQKAAEADIFAKPEEVRLKGPKLHLEAPSVETGRKPVTMKEKKG